MTASTDALVRQERLADRVKDLRAPSRLGITGSDRWMLYVGGTLLPLGLVLVVLGWWGSSHTVLVFEQIPYMVSGGLLGLACVFAGGFVYFAYWLTILVRESRTAREDLQAVLLRMESLLQEQVAPAPRTAKGVAAVELVATKTGSMMHRPDCVAVDGRSELRTVTASTPGLSPCRLCDPLAEQPL